MHVKSLKFTISSTWLPDSMVYNVHGQGSATLGSWAANGRFVALTDVNFGRNNVGLPSAWRADVLFILGGRRSICQWLRLQGDAPIVGNPVGDCALHATVMRKKRLLDKDLTLVALHSVADLHVEDEGWQARKPIDLRKSPEALSSIDATMKLGEFKPKQLASILERLFCGYNW